MALVTMDSTHISILPTNHFFADTLAQKAALSASRHAISVGLDGLVDHVINVAIFAPANVRLDIVRMAAEHCMSSDGFAQLFGAKLACALTCDMGSLLPREVDASLWGHDDVYLWVVDGGRLPAAMLSRCREIGVKVLAALDSVAVH
jgi:hypothetical protein